MSTYFDKALQMLYLMYIKIGVKLRDFFLLLLLEIKSFLKEYQPYEK